MLNKLLIVPDEYIDQQTGNTIISTTGSSDFIIISLYLTIVMEMVILNVNFLEVAYIIYNLDFGHLVEIFNLCGESKRY